MSNPKIHTRVVSKYTEFELIKDDWNKLVSENYLNSVFLSHEWFDSAWQWRKQNSKLTVLTVYINDELSGIFPLIISNRRHKIANTNTLEFLAIPDTQYCDFILSKKYRKLLIKIFFDWLYSANLTWDNYDLRYFSESSLVPELILKYSSNIQKKVYLSYPDNNYFIRINTTWDDFYKKRSRRLKKGNNLVANHLKRAGEIKIECVKDRELIEEVLPVIIEISSKSWKNETGLTLEQPSPGKFIQKLTQHASKNGWLNIWILYLNNIPIATEYQILHNGNIYALRADYDERYANLSPGTYLNWKILQSIFNSEHDYYYLGRGENPYKLRWTTTHEQMPAIIGYNNNYKALLILFYDEYLHKAIIWLRNKFQQ